MRRAVVLFCGLIAATAQADTSASLIDLDSIDPARFEKQCKTFLRTYGDGLSGVDCSKALSQIKSLGPLDGLQQAQILTVLVEHSRAETINYKDLGAKLNTIVPGLLDTLAQDGITLSGTNSTRQTQSNRHVASGAKFVRP